MRRGEGVALLPVCSLLSLRHLKVSVIGGDMRCDISKNHTLKKSAVVRQRFHSQTQPWPWRPSTIQDMTQVSQYSLTLVNSLGQYWRAHPGVGNEGELRDWPTSQYQQPPSKHPATTQTQNQRYELAHPIVCLIYDVLEHVKGLVLQTRSYKIKKDGLFMCVCVNVWRVYVFLKVTQGTEKSARCPLSPSDCSFAVESLLEPGTYIFLAELKYNKP